MVDLSTDSNAWVLVAVTSANATNTSDSGRSTNTLYSHSGTPPVNVHTDNAANANLKFYRVGVE